jgi:hypothetical protein
MFATSRREAALTARFLNPVTPALEELFLSLRAETDQSLGSRAPAKNGKPYPYGYCREITCDVLTRLNDRMKHPRHPAERAIKVYLNRGGTGRRVWGALRDRYFQNALKVGGLYIDVSNDSVDINKPKVEILRMDQSGLEKIRDAAHFVRIGALYWGETFYANHAIPSLAPMFPILGVDRSGRARLHSEGAHMVKLFCGSDFALSERWLEEGPAPPAAVVEALRANCPADLIAINPVPGKAAALEACGQARADGLASNLDWRAARTADLVRCLTASIPVLERG